MLAKRPHNTERLSSKEEKQANMAKTTMVVLLNRHGIECLQSSCLPLEVNAALSLPPEKQGVVVRHSQVVTGPRISDCGVLSLTQDIYITPSDTHR